MAIAWSNFLAFISSRAVCPDRGRIAGLAKYWFQNTSGLSDLSILMLATGSLLAGRDLLAEVAADVAVTC